MSNKRSDRHGGGWWGHGWWGGWDHGGGWWGWWGR